MAPESVVIVGAGVFGLSAALSLSNANYNVTVIDKFPVPSPRSAANDLNKIIRTEYDHPFYTKLSLEALARWRSDPLFRDVYVESGRVTLSPSGEANAHRAKFEQRGLDNLKNMGASLKPIVDIRSGSELAALCPMFAQNGFGDIAAKFNPNAGFGHASKSLIKVFEACVSSGVSFQFGVEGEAKALSLTPEPSVTVKSGKKYTADKIILALGASTPALLPLSQVRSLGLFVTHIELTEQEYSKYKDIPIFFSSEIGYFFPPDKETRLLKVALTYADTYNEVVDPWGNNTRLPRYKDEYGDTFPVEGENHVRNVLRLTLPELADHPLVESKVCWISDTVDSNFLIDFHPESNKVLVATGDSGHGYKFLPNIGDYIRLRLENNLSSEAAQKWKWRQNVHFPEKIASRTTRQHIEIKSIQNWWQDKSKL